MVSGLATQLLASGPGVGVGVESETVSRLPTQLLA